MKVIKPTTILLFLTLLVTFGCAAMHPDIPVEMASYEPGSRVTFKGEWHDLLGTPLSVGDKLPSVELVDSATMKPVNLADERGSVLLLSVIVSVDTGV
jgi:hypothetical protein